MKALLIGSLFVILLIIGGAVSFMIIDSANTIDAQAVAQNVPLQAEKAVEQNKAKISEEPSVVDNGETGVSAEDKLNEFKSEAPANNSPKSGFTIEYQAQQGNCNDFIELLEDEVSEAEEDYADARKAYDKATDDLIDLDNGDSIEEAQEEIKEKKEILDKAEDALFAAREKLIKARTTCKS